MKMTQAENVANTKDFSIDIPNTICQDGVQTGEQKTFVGNNRCPSQASSLSSNSGDICRICHCEGGPDLPLITPCYCSGSLRYVHQTCLQQWIKSSNIRNCELCKFQFIMQTKVKPFNEWEYLEMSGLERKKLLCAMLFHIIAMTCVCWSLYVLIDRTLDEVQKGHLEWPFWTKLIVVGIGFMGGIVFMYIQCKAYFILCKRWKAYNRVIYVQNAPEKSMLPTTNRSSVEESDKNVTEPSCSFKHTDSRKLNADNLPETSCIDIKGVRNLHIFFGEENQIRLHRNDRLPENSALIQSERFKNCEETQIDASAKTEKGNHTYGNTSLHIQIGNVDCGRRSNDVSYCNLSNSKSKENSSYGGALCPPDLKVSRLHDYEGKDKYRNEFKNDQSVVKLQIKKAEIVIEFAENSDANKCAVTKGNSNSRQLRNSTYLPNNGKCNGTAVPINSSKRKFSSEEYLDFEKVADECNELPTSRLLIIKDHVPYNNKDKCLFKDWRSSEDLVSINDK